MSRFLKIIALYLISTALAFGIYLTPLGLWLEERGLDALFLLRGERAAPEAVVVVALQKDAAEALGVEREPGRWPRDLHARLIDILHRAGAAAIVFDIHFNEPRSGEDSELARAIQEAGNVVLFARLEREFSVTPAGRITVDHLQTPAPRILAAPPAAVAPFALPDTGRVRYFWSFYSDAGDLPTLPAMALAVYGGEMQTRLIEALAERYPDQGLGAHEHKATAGRNLGMSEQAVVLRGLFQRYPQASEVARAALDEPPLSARESRLLNALLGLYRGASPAYLNFYGPPRTLRTLPFDEVLAASGDLSDTFRNKVVFVGFSAEQQPDELDVFNTVFRERGGLDISGVEIAATAFANLLEGSLIEPLPSAWFSLLIIAYSLILARLAKSRDARVAVGLSALFALTYAVVAYVLFRESAIWLPQIGPIAIITPIVVFTALMGRYTEARRAEGSMRRAFTYYLPDQIVEQLSADPDSPRSDESIRYGICLATDAEQYTPLAERMAPDDLSRYMNEYYELLFAPVKARGGRVFDVIGDAMLAIWTSERPDTVLKHAACNAAWDIIGITDTLQHEGEIAPLPTRIGLHVGELVTTNIGAADRYEYRAVGDVVNTATRIQNLNKRLGTRLIASREVLAGTSGFITRDLGRFLLKGKRQAVALQEILGVAGQADARCFELTARFAQGLVAFKAGLWEEAANIFRQIKHDFDNDGPATFYLQLCEHYLETPPSDPIDGLVSVNTA